MKEELTVVIDGIKINQYVTEFGKKTEFFKIIEILPDGDSIIEQVNHNLPEYKEIWVKLHNYKVENNLK